MVSSKPAIPIRPRAMRSHGAFLNSAKCPFCGAKRMFTLIPRLTEVWIYRLRPAGLAWSLRPKPEHLIRQRPLQSEASSAGAVSLKA